MVQIMAKKSKRDQRKGGRRKKGRKLRRYLIVSEDKKSSLLYLNGFITKISSDIISVKTEGEAGDTCKVVERGIELWKASVRAREPYVHVYCAIDKDDFTKARYERAFDLVAANQNITVIWGNECFELWYLLHFRFQQAAIGRKDIERQLNKLLSKKYSKSDATIFAELEEKLEVAKRHADQLQAAQLGAPRPWSQNPSTNVQVLVRKLEELAE